MSEAGCSVLVSYLSWWPKALRGRLVQYASTQEDVFAMSREQGSQFYLQRPYVSRPLAEAERIELQLEMEQSPLLNGALSAYSTWQPEVFVSSTSGSFAIVAKLFEYLQSRDATSVAGQVWRSLVYCDYPRFAVAMRYFGEGFPPGDAAIIDKYTKNILDWRYVDASLMIRSETKLDFDRVLFQSK